MKPLVTAAVILTALGCNMPNKQKVTETRPASQLKFNKIVDSISHDYSTIDNAAKMDERVSFFNKYAQNELKDINNWEVVVNEVSDDNYSKSSFADAILDPNLPVYNLKMYSVIRMYDKIDKSRDSLNLPQGDVIFITCTVPKQEKQSKNGKSWLNVVKNASNGDTLLISGSITHIDENLKPDFRSLISEDGYWNVDLIPTEIKKK